MVSPAKIGTCTITVTSVSNPELSKTIEVEIYDYTCTLPVTSVTVEGERELYVGYETQLTARVYPLSCNHSVTWEVHTSSKDIATIDKNGVVKALKEGTFRVRAVCVQDPTIKSSYFSIYIMTFPEPIVINDMKGYQIVIMTDADDMENIDPFREGYKNPDKIFKQRAWNEVEENYKKATVVSHKKYLSAVEDVKTGKADCIIMDELPAKEIVKENENLVILDGFLFQDKYGMIVKKGNDELKDQINKVLERMVNDGTINDLIIAKTAKIGEKLSLRRFVKVTKSDSESFGEYIHMGGKIAVLTIVNNANEETAKDVSMHAAAMRPLYVKRENVPADEIEKERAILKEQAINEGKPAEIAEKMVEGRIQKYYKEVCLEEQPFVKDGDVTVSTFVKNNGGKIANMIRYEVGEGMEKRNDDFASEVMSQINNA